MTLNTNRKINTSPMMALKDPDHKALIIWLLSCAFMVFMMVVIGGATRLTDSGLSMTNWKPITGFLPPLSIEEWEVVFAQYRQSPEYQKINFGMTLIEFKKIFWWEFIHRVWGRLIGLVFFIPFVIFTLQKKIPKPYYKHFLILFFLGGLQGFIGWWMVKSGLVDKPDVSHFRLAAHLGMALFIYGYIISLIYNLKNTKYIIEPLRLKRSLAFGLILISATIIYGAFVSGLDAGLIYNSFPFMGEGLFPSDGLFLTPLYSNFIHNPSTIQFTHRLLAITTYIAIIYVFLWGLSQKTSIRKISFFLFLAATLQVFLGIITLLTQVELKFAILHQTGALILLTLYIWLLKEVGFWQNTKR